MSKKSTCKTGLKKEIIGKEIFDREIAICRDDIHRNQGGCCWGRCDSCGVIPLLHKLYNGELIDGGKELKKLRKKLLEK